MGIGKPAPAPPIAAPVFKAGEIGLQEKRLREGKVSLPHKCVFNKGIRWRPQKCYTQCRHNANPRLSHGNWWPRPPFRSKKFSNGYLIGSILGSFFDMETASWCFFNIKKPTVFGFLVAATQCQGSGVDAQVKRTRFSEPGAVGAFCWKTCDFGLCSFLIKGGSS